MPSATGECFVSRSLHCTVRACGWLYTGVRCYVMLLQCNHFTPLSISDLAHGPRRTLNLFYSVGLCLAAAAVAHSFLLLASSEAAMVAMVTALGIPACAIAVSMAPAGMDVWLFYFSLPLLFLL